MFIMALVRWLQTAKDAIQFKSGVWGTGGGGFLLAGVSFMLAGHVTLGWIVVSFGFAMLFWGTTIWGRNLWEKWWLGPIRPDIDSYLFDFPYRQGADVHGITWDQDFSHVNLRIANRSGELLTDLNFVIFFDRKIIRSVSVSALTDCTVGPDRSGLPQITLIATDNNGEKVALAGAEVITLADIRHRDRFLCAKLPHGVEIQLHLATVDPIWPPPASQKMWRKVNPTWVSVGGTYRVRGLEQHVMWHQLLGKAS
jgi:hypothetical protein